MTIAGYLLIAAAAAATQPERPGSPADGGERVVIGLQPYAGRLVTASALLGRERLTLLLDTGGGQTLITPGAAARLGCTPHGRHVSFRMNGERVVFQHCATAGLELGGRRLGLSTIAVWDVMAVLPKELPPLDGVLALDALQHVPFTLDLAARSLTLESTRSLEQRVATMSRVDARVATGPSGGELTMFLRGAIDEPGWFLFDSANLDLTIVAPHMLRRTPAVPSRIASAVLSLEGLPPRSVPLSVRDILYDGVLSEELLREWLWTFRIATRDLWATRERDSPER
jgi:hypothetical protein